SPTHRGFCIERPNVLEPLVPDPRKRLDLAGHHRGLEPGGLELRAGALEPEKREDREHEPPARLEMRGGAADHPIQDLPTVDASVVSRGCRVAPRAAWRRRQLRGGRA